MESFQELYEKANKNNKAVMLYLRKEENLNLLINETLSLPNDISKSERYYCWLNKLIELPKCPHCGEKRKFCKVDKGYFPTCGDKNCKAAGVAYGNKFNHNYEEIQKKNESNI